MSSIPERYRITDEGGVLRQIRRPTLQEINDLDPSESIRNYDPNEEEDVALLQRMIDFGRHHIGAGEIGSDFTLVIARSRGA
jgi:hypothetical protein